jgi:outer membrane autotransporter protein
VPRGTTGIFGAGVTGIINDTWALFIHYTGEAGGNYSEHTGVGGVRISF